RVGTLLGIARVGTLLGIARVGALLGIARVGSLLGVARGGTLLGIARGGSLLGVALGGSLLGIGLALPWRRFRALWGAGLCRDRALLALGGDLAGGRSGIGRRGGPGGPLGRDDVHRLGRL